MKGFLLLFILLHFTVVTNAQQNEHKHKCNKKIFYEFTYGLGSLYYGPCEKVIQNYHYDYKSIAGCLVSRKILFKAFIHNSWVHFRMHTIYGKEWRQLIKKECE